MLNGAAKDTLIALVECGPLEDGDVPSKLGRDCLLELGLAAKVIVKGRDGFQAATYAGAEAYRQMFGEPTIAECMAVRKTRLALSRIRNRTTPPEAPGHGE